MLADSSNGYSIDFNVYIGRAAGQDISANGLGYDVVMRLMQPFPGLEITAGQRTMSGLMGDLTSQTFVMPVIYIDRSKFNRIENEINLRFLLFNCYLSSRCVLRNFDVKSW